MKAMYGGWYFAEFPLTEAFPIPYEAEGKGDP